MKNIVITVSILLIVAVSGFVFYTSTQKPTQTNQQEITKSLAQPERQAELNGYLLSIEGNELTVANEIGAKEITDEERARRQKLSQEERQALKAAESANLQKENVTLTIPVGVTIVKGSGDGSGTNVEASFEELTKGTYLSIWQNENGVEFVKLKGVSQ